MGIIVVGAGEVGYNVAKKLSREGKEITVIDKDEDRIKRVAETLDVHTVLGSGSSLVDLKEAGVDKANMIIAVTNSDEVNMVCCLVASTKAVVPIKIARLRGKEYLDARLLEKLDIDLVINPDEETVRHLLRILPIPGARDVVEFAEGKVLAVGMIIERGSPLSGKSLEELGREYPEGVIVGAIYRSGSVIIPSGRDRLMEGDLVYFLGQRELLLRILPPLSGKGKAGFPQRVMILGGGNLGYLLAEALESKGISSKVVETDPERCEFLASRLKKCMVLKWDVEPYEELMKEQNIREMDCFLALTPDEEKNILFALLAKTMGAKRVVASVHRISLIPMALKTGVDVVVSPSLIAVNRILQYVRRGKVLNVALLPEEQAEMIETVAMETSDLVKGPIRELGLPKGVLVGAILRNDGEVIVPRGDTQILPGDKVTLIASLDSLRQLEKILMVKLEYW